MQAPILQTDRLRLFAHAPKQLRTLLEGTESYERLVGIRLAVSRGRRTPRGVVEIAYGIVDAYQGRGYATEVARALMTYASECGRANTIRAHTLPVANDSTRVLEMCGFQRVGEVIDPEDGPVWRWECRPSGPGP